MADFFSLDHRRQKGGKIVPIDDLAIINAIKPSGIFDPRTGLELIDDNTLPEWLLSKNKANGKILRDPDGKPYLSLKTLISLCLGAIRQLAKKRAMEFIKHPKLFESLLLLDLPGSIIVVWLGSESVG